MTIDSAIVLRFLCAVAGAICSTGVYAVHPAGASASAQNYAVARQATPVYHSAAAARTVPEPDHCGQVRELEFIALPNAPFTVVRRMQQVVEVTTPDYRAPAAVRLYVHQSFLEFLATAPPPRTSVLPEKNAVISALRSAVGLPYVWGGNVRQGVEGRYKGLDCSGLLYEATNGFTLRNTADLVSFGAAVPVAGLTADQILSSLRPLDLLVWKGHVIIVLDRETAIESILRCGQPGQGGVVTVPLKKRLLDVMKTRIPSDRWPEGGAKAAVFVVRRWI